MFQAIAQFTRAILAIGLIGIILVVGGVIGIIAADAFFGPKAADFANVTFPNASGETITGHLNIPQANDIFPAVILLPDQWGLNDERIRIANRLSDQGYVVLTLDIYRGQGTGVILRAMLLAATTAETDVLTDIEAAYDYLVELDQVDPDHIGLVGFSLGGGLALDYAVQHPEIAATVNLYGDVITDPDTLRGSGPIMGIFPAEGTSFPIEDFEAALEAAAVTYEVNRYEGVGPDFVAFPTVSINNTAASDAFDDMLDFLDTALKPE